MVTTADRARKQVSHTCGQALWVQVIARIEDDVLVHYEPIGVRNTVTLGMCPRCHRMLRLWWKDPMYGVSETEER